MLEIKNISYSFGQHKILDKLNLSFDIGKVVGVVGSNGVGKTTLFRIMCQIYSLQSGSITLFGKKLIPTDIVFMPTEPFFYPFMKGSEYIKIVVNTKNELEKANLYGKILDLPLNDLVDNYSTGMRKKLAFSALFALNKPAIILDEPYNGVDLDSNEIIKHLIRTQTGDRTVILSSHILSTITDICHSVYHLTENHEVSYYSQDHFRELEEYLSNATKSKLKQLDTSIGEPKSEFQQ